MKLPKVGDKVTPVSLRADSSYITVGQRYVVTSAEGEFFTVIDDEGDAISCLFPYCLHAEKWEIVE